MAGGLGWGGRAEGLEARERGPVLAAGPRLVPAALGAARTAAEHLQHEHQPPALRPGAGQRHLALVRAERLAAAAAGVHSLGVHIEAAKSPRQGHGSGPLPWDCPRPPGPPQRQADPSPRQALRVWLLAADLLPLSVLSWGSEAILGRRGRGGWELMVGLGDASGGCLAGRASSELRPGPGRQLPQANSSPGRGGADTLTARHRHVGRAALVGDLLFRLSHAADLWEPMGGGQSRPGWGEPLRRPCT